jgi:hypothetical protein
MTGGSANQVMTQSREQATYVCHSLSMVVELPFAREKASSNLVYVACLECWLMNVRLMAEFLLIKPSKSKLDFSATNFGWDKKQNVNTADVKECWLVASTHLVHFGLDRAPKDLDMRKPFDTTFEGLKNVSETVLYVMKDFVLCLEANNHPEAKYFRTALDHAFSKHNQTIPTGSE